MGRQQFAFPYTPLATSVRSAETCDLTVPTDRGVDVPGNYERFALDAAGTWSPSRTVNVS